MNVQIGAMSDGQWRPRLKFFIVLRAQGSNSQQIRITPGWKKKLCLHTRMQ
jgi:murein endopeptidase